MKKKVNVILIIVVLGLWGTLAYRFINNYFANEQANLLQRSATPVKSLVVRRDTFEMVGLERDPFLDTHRTIQPDHRQLRYGAPPSTPKPNSSIQAAMAAPWPEIQYFGYIKSGNSSEVAVLRIDGRLHRLRKGEVNQGLLVKSVYRDSLVVIYNKEKRVFLHAG